MTDGISSSDVDDLPPSAKYVLDVVDRDGPLSRQELQERTGLPETTLDDAVKTLENRDYLLRTRDSEDLRQVVMKTVTMRTYNPSRE